VVLITSILRTVEIAPWYRKKIKAQRACSSFRSRELAKSSRVRSSLDFLLKVDGAIEIESADDECPATKKFKATTAGDAITLLDDVEEEEDAKLPAQSVIGSHTTRQHTQHPPSGGPDEVVDLA
jgi:hypothetical protein